MKAIRNWVLTWLCSRPMKIEFIEDGYGHVYMIRSFVIPRNRWLNIYFHHFTGNDRQRDMHDHPWWSVSWILRGSYVEYTPDDNEFMSEVAKVCREGQIVVRPPEFTHRIELHENDYAMTLFITGPKVRDWGFHTSRGWKHWKGYLNK